jgi:hypothetical protein
MNRHLNAVDQRPRMPDVEQQIDGFSVLLWSQSQNCFHVELVRHMLASNRRAYSEKRRMDYVPVFFGCHEACCRLADTLRATVRARESERVRIVGQVS